MEEESNELPGSDPGDIVLTVQTFNHPIFERRGNDLYTKFTIDLIEALTGFSKSITHLDQTPVNLKRTGVTQYGLVEVIRGAGMPFLDNHDQFGDLFVEYIVEFPKQVDTDFINGNFSNLHFRFYTCLTFCFLYRITRPSLEANP